MYVAPVLVHYTGILVHTIVLWLKPCRVTNQSCRLRRSPLAYGIYDDPIPMRPEDYGQPEGSAVQADPSLKAPPLSTFDTEKDRAFNSAFNLSPLVCLSLRQPLLRGFPLVQVPSTRFDDETSVWEKVKHATVGSNHISRIQRITKVQLEGIEGSQVKRCISDFWDTLGYHGTIGRDEFNVLFQVATCAQLPKEKVHKVGLTPRNRLL